MKLELQHLAPYLPYKLMLSYFDISEYKRKAYLTGITLNEIETTYIRKIRGCSGDLISWSGNNDVIALQIKPILHPLSDLTKEIEVNKKRFVPIIEIGNSIDGGPGYTHSSLTALNKLFEWHFDVFGLIETGLAININTIEWRERNDND